MVQMRTPGIPAIRIPTKVAELMEIGRGHFSYGDQIRKFAERHKSVNIHNLFLDGGMAAYPPPTLNIPTCIKAKNNLKKQH